MTVRSVAAVAALALLATPLASAGDGRGLANRKVLTDLSGGFCRSYKFGLSISDNVLYMVGLDGGLIPGDEDGGHNYLVTLDLKSSFPVNDGSSYKMVLVDSTVPKVKQQALWSDKSNSTLFMYGGRYVDNTTANPTTYTYSTKDKKWAIQDGSIQPNRLVYGAYTDAREIQAAFWIGGYQDSSTTLNIKNQGRKEYAMGMIQLNTTTQDFSSLEAPMTPVQEGALLYLPVGKTGVLVFIGGDTPSVRDGTDAKLSANSWNTVQIYDISAKKWYNQTTTGTVKPRTQFCATAHYDKNTDSYAIYVLGGVGLTNKQAMKDVSYLTVPSFQWYSAKPLDQQRMTHACAAYGSQIFAVGGRLAWADQQDAGCYDVPALLYNAHSEETVTNFDPDLSSYSLSSTAAKNVKESPYPSSWADPALKELFTSNSKSDGDGSGGNSDSDSTPDDSKSSKKSTSVAAIAGGVVGGAAGLALIAAAAMFFMRRRRKRNQNQQPTSEDKQQVRMQPNAAAELYTDEPRGELDGGGSNQVFEMDGASRR